MRWLALTVFVAALGTVLDLAGCGRSAPVAAPPVTAAPAPAVPGPTEGAPAAAEAEAEALPEPNRPLTAGERAMLRPIYRDGIDYDKVRVIDAPFPFQPAGTYMTPRGHIYAPGRLFRDDFSRPGLPAIERAVFVHEIGHVWQFANGIDLVANAVADFAKYRGDYEKAYPYRLAPGRDLAEYGMEQQASILEDHYLVTVAHEGPYRMENRGVPARDRDALFADVLHRFTADARYARGIDAGALAARHEGAGAGALPAEPALPPGAPHMCSWRFAPPKQ